MKAANYNLVELNAIVRFCTWSLAAAVNVQSFLRELAAIMEADCAIAVRHGPQFKKPSFIASADTFSVAGGPRAFASEAATLQSSLPQKKGVSFCDGRRTLASVLPRATQCDCALILSRRSRRFSARDAQSLQVIHSTVSQKLIALQALSLAGRPADLPPRIQDVKDGLLEGLSDKQIAARLRISPHTVHTHVKSLFKRQGEQSVRAT